MTARQPASIRFKNPGAMWGNALAIKWGAEKKAVKLNDGKGQGNNIAVFPTYVAGICAQLDLWRTSKHYRNKRFEDAIAIWSGHNEVESYIKFVLARVPGMTRDTIMDDEFWSSPKGIAFLKAQAWHEAGKKYPAPDKDWIEAQKRVFDGVPSAGVPAKPAPPALPLDETIVQGDPDLWNVQRRLKAMNYLPGKLDGKWGGITTGAIGGFMNDRHLTFAAPTSAEMFKEILEPLNAEISKAETEVPSFTRPIAQERAEATPAELAPKIPEIKSAQNASWWSKVQGWWSAGFGGVTAAGLVTNLMTAQQTVEPIKSWFGDKVPFAIGGAFVLAVIFVAIVLAKKASGAANDSANAATKAFQEGARV